MMPCKKCSLLLSICIILLLVFSLALLKNNTTYSAVCANGSISESLSKRGTCSHNGGVQRWLR